MLKKLFTSKNRIKIIQFLLFETDETYIREISKKLKISPSAVKREIENLLELRLIVRIKKRLKLNKNSNILSDLKNIFIKTDYLYYPIKDSFNKIKKIKFALIFGSFSRGEYSEDSDVDLLIIGDLKLSEGIKLLNPIEEKINREINPVVWTIENLEKEKNSGFVRDIFKKKL